MTKSRTRRTCKRISGQCGVGNPARTGMPYRHAERHAGKSDGSGRRRHVLPREISGSVRNSGLPRGQPGGTGPEKSAEAIVAQPGWRPERPPAGVNPNSILTDLEVCPTRPPGKI